MSQKGARQCLIALLLTPTARVFESNLRPCMVSVVRTFSHHELRAHSMNCVISHCHIVMSPIDVKVMYAVICFGISKTSL